MNRVRDEILGRIRKAIGEARAAPEGEWAGIERGYRRNGILSRDERVELFASRIVHYDGSVMRCRLPELPPTIAATLSARGKTHLHVPAGVDPGWLPNAVTFVPDSRLTFDELDRSFGVMTACTVAIAETGTIVLTHGAEEGRRALTLVPDYQLAVVLADQIVETVPEGMSRAAASSPSLITTISGPSATADIEMTRVKGVHGPRVLDVILVE